MTDLQIIKNKNLRGSFLATGDLFELASETTMINQLHSNVLDGSLNQIYLRVYQGEEIKVAPLIGSNSKSKFGRSTNQLIWQGQFAAVEYDVTFQLSSENIWFWTIKLSGDSQLIDLVYGQDIGNASKGAVQANEAYMSQYLDHHIAQFDQKIVVSSRQNQPQGGNFPLVEQGSLSPLRAYATDGYQFFGKTYKETDIPQALYEKTLANEVYQYEFAYIALQTELMTLSQASTEVVFYGAFKENQGEAVSEPVFPQEKIVEVYQSLVAEKLIANRSFKKNLGAPIVGESLSREEIEVLFPERYEVEEVKGTLYSFFTENYQHVVLKEKELEMERAHGHILFSKPMLTVDQPVLSTTVYMYGIFNSQIVLGNTSNHKLTSNSRNSLNVMKNAGQRIYLKLNSQWQLLTMPSAFVMGLNSATWYYKLAEDTIKVRTFTLVEQNKIVTEVSSETGKQYTWVVSNHLIMGPNEEEPEFNLIPQPKGVKIESTSQLVKSKYPDLAYDLSLDKPFKITDEQLFVGDLSVGSLTVFEIEAQSKFVLTTQGSLTKTEFIEQQEDFNTAETNYVAEINRLLNGFNLSHDQIDVASMNTLSRWYTHNMLVHYLSPHGLEQYGGAAWGTRDVSQGPTEFFFATNRPEAVASIIEKTYENQFEDDGNWPQWFMFDRYEEQKADESHGDIIVWPLKVVADYLEKTKDYSILTKKIPYTDRETFKRTKPEKTLLAHIKKEIAYIKANFLHETFLSSYGDGDWDDTLQPQNSALKKNMVSSWTVALTYQVLKKFASLIQDYEVDFARELGEIVKGIKADYKKYILTAETIPGFLYLEDPTNPELMIHPTDQKTGIQYRLLPMTRSMIAELLTPAQVEHHLNLIKEHLYFPDGVHLMNQPAQYKGGVSTNFKRAEQAANFGREIGLQYVHAHIRFVEAMAKIGLATETWKGLNTINPIGIQKHVPNAEIRQANAYFSSSDGKFKTRYEAQANFKQLKTGSVPVKGGWRIYSSGPGIYLNQLLTNVLGVRETKEQIIFDPILPEELNNLTMTYRILKQDVLIKFYRGTNKEGVYLNQEALPTTFEQNPYRQGGFVIEADVLKEKLGEVNLIEVFNK